MTPSQVTNIENLIPQDSWFRSYMRCFPVSEPPRSYILFTAMSVLGACLGRDVYMEGKRQLYPILNLLLIGPSGIGKSTSIAYAEELLKFVAPEDQPEMVFDASTPEGLHEHLVHNPKALIVASELATFFGKQKYMEGMLPYVTRLFDYPPRLPRRLKGGGSEVHRPAAGLIGGSTVEWLQGQLPDTATSGGFLARFFIVKEDHKFQRIPNEKRALGAHAKALEKFTDETFSKFTSLAAMRGPVDFEDYSAVDEYDQWYTTYQPAGGHLSPFSARAGEFALRLATLFAVSRRSLAINAEDLKAAIGLYEYGMRKLQEVVVPFSPQGKLMAKILDILSSGDVDRKFICRAMRNFTTSAETEKYIDSLIKTGEVVELADGNLRKVQK